MAKRTWLRFEDGDLGSSSLGSGGEAWEDRGDRAQEEGDEVDKTEEAGQAGGDTGNVAGQGNEATLCDSTISVVPLCVCVMIRDKENHLRPNA